MSLILKDAQKDICCEFNQIIEFEPESDNFQKLSYWGIEQNYAVISNAPTGSGKSRIFNYAIAKYLNEGYSVALTTPIKALSNQKFFELTHELIPYLQKKLKKTFTVGILTGDIKINPDADVVVMTTEILNESLNNFGDSTVIKENRLEQSFMDRLKCVIFDEAHYINDDDRGHAWDSVLVKLDKSINVILLSATLSNINDFGLKLSKVRDREVCIVKKNERIVPLTFYLYNENNLVEIMDNKNNFNTLSYDKTISEIKKRNINSTGELNSFVSFLKNNNLLQTIFFILSRKQCERMAQLITHNLITHDERKEIDKIYNSKMRQHDREHGNTQQFILVKKLIQKGVCFHHSKLIPVLKEFIEILFQKGLIKIMFVTETFAVGLNMPTRTVVFTSLEKPTSKGKRLLMPHEFKQMSGRAGRRGKDTKGNVIFLTLNDTIDSSSFKQVVSGKLKKITSKLKIDYSLILKVYLSDLNFTNFINNSMLGFENKEKIDFYKNKLSKLELNKPDIDKQTENNFNKIIEFENMSSSFGTSFKIDKKKQNLINNLKKKYKSSNELKIFRKYKKKLIEYEQINSELNYYENVFENEKNIVVDILNSLGFINNNKITSKGIIASQINDCNPLLLTEMLFYDLNNDNIKSNELMFYGLSPEEIICLISVFASDKNNNEILLESVNCPDNIKNRLSKVNYLIDKMTKVENRYKIHNNDFWNISFEYIEASYMWAKGYSFNDCISKLENDNGGGFIKTMIRINNIVSNIIQLSKLCMNTKLLENLCKVEQLILREQVTIKSLYIE